MAHFRGTLEGNRGAASRLGTKASGLTVTANGWSLGVTVYGQYDKGKDADEFTVYLTGGSNQRGESVHLGTFTRADLEEKLKRRKQ